LFKSKNDLPQNSTFLMPTVSVIIPNYNHSHFLKDRIDSIINQSFQDFELIILDDCSNDHSRNLIEKYRSNLKVSSIIYNEANSGSTFVQWKKGIELAKGKYIWIAESDDLADERLLENLVPVLNDNTNAGLIFCNSVIINIEGKIIGNTNDWTDQHLQNQDDNKITLFNGFDFCKKHLFLVCRLPNASAVVFRRDIVINNLHWVDESLKNSGDWKLWLNIALNYDLLWVNKNLNYFRKHTNNVTNSLTYLKKEALIILKEIINNKNYRKHYRLFESSCIWSFNSLAWQKDSTYNKQNFILYFKKNISFYSIFYLAFYLLKQVYLFIKSTFKNI